MNTSPTIAAIADALAKAQAEIQNPVKDRTARVKSDKADYTYQYADLANVLDAVRPVLAKHGIAILQAPAVAADQLSVTTRLIHSSGEWIETVLTTGIDPQAKIQTLGSGITYLRRYALQAIVGVVAEEDDDGNGAQGNAAQTQQRRPAPAAPAGNGAAPATPGATKAASPVAPPPAPSTAPTSAAPAAPSADPHKTECDRLVKQLGEIAGQDFAKQLWHATKPGEKRRDLLRQAHAACAEVISVLGEGRGTEVLVDLTRREVSVIDRVALLVRASLGEPVPADPSQPPF